MTASVAKIYLVTNTSEGNVFLDGAPLTRNATKVVWNISTQLQAAIDAALVLVEDITGTVDTTADMTLEQLQLIVSQLNQLPGPLDKDVVVGALATAPVALVVEEERGPL
jgi:hypothetical protein